MWIIASIVNSVFNIILAPFRSMHPAVGLLVVSIITGIVMVFIFGKTSNQDAIRRIKGRVKAHIAEIWLFRNDLGQMLLASLRVFGNTGRYFAHSLRPLIFILVPVIVIMVMLGVRYEHRPFAIGDTAVVAARVSDPAWARGNQVSLVGSEGVEVVSPALRIPRKAEINWKIRTTSSGVHEITLRTPAGEVTKKVHVADDAGPLVAIADARGSALSGTFLTLPAEPPLPGSSGVRRLSIEGWPHRELRFFGLKIHWLIVFFVVSLVAGFSVKGLFGVEV